MLFFKFHQNRTTNGELDFGGLEVDQAVGGGVPRYEKFGKTPYRIVVPFQTEILSTLPQS